MDILLSVKPKYVQYIRAGKKRVELRKSFPVNKEISRIYIYESSPVKKICGYIEPKTISKFPVPELWEKTKSLSCVEESDFNKYYQGKETGIGIFFDAFIPLPLTSLDIVLRNAPQSYANLTSAQSSVLEKLQASAGS